MVEGDVYGCRVEKGWTCDGQFASTWRMFFDAINI